MEHFDGINALRITPAIREALKRCPFPTFEASCSRCGEACTLSEDEETRYALDEGVRLLCDECGAIEWGGRGPTDSSFISQARQWLEQELKN